MMNQSTYIPEPNFPTDYESAKKRLKNFSPSNYAGSRNHVDGGVSYLSPYITHGLLTLPQVRDSILEAYALATAKKYIFELAWREYYQNTWRELGADIFSDIFNEKKQWRTKQMITAVQNANTNINALDSAIETLFETGYMHNHARMWVGGLVCNIAGAHWLEPSRWLYYHLLDGDPASNMLSWQSVAGTFTGRQYLPAQQNINKYTQSEQKDTYLDHSYETLGQMDVPDALEDTHELQLTPHFPDTDEINISSDTVLLYHPFSLDPDWRKNQAGDRVLVIDRDFYTRFPVSKKVMEFIESAARKNIPDIQIHVGTPDDFLSGDETVHYKRHPLTKNWPGVGDKPEKLFPEVSGFYPSFSKFWNDCKPYLKQFN